MRSVSECHFISFMIILQLLYLNLNAKRSGRLAGKLQANRATVHTTHYRDHYRDRGAITITASCKISEFLLTVIPQGSILVAIFILLCPGAVAGFCLESYL